MLRLDVSCRYEEKDRCYTCQSFHGAVPFRFELWQVVGVTITIMRSKSRTPGVVRSPSWCLSAMGKRIYRANALATQAKQCALGEQTGLELAVLDHAEATRLTN